jgi:hypothetical protein
LTARFRKLLPQSLDLNHLLSVGFLSKICPRSMIDSILEKYEKTGKRVRLLPAAALVYFIMALSLWREPPQEEVLRIVCESLTWIIPDFDNRVLPAKGAVSRARYRLGPDVMREAAGQTLKPLAPLEASEAWYNGMRLMAVDVTCFDVLDSKVNADYFGYPSSSRGDTAFPQLRVAGLAETGTHIIAAAQVRPYKRSEQEMTAALISSGKFTPEMLIMADRNFYGYKLWKQAFSTGANLLWRIKSNLVLPAER